MLQRLDLSRFLDYQIAVTVIMVIIAWKWGDWRNWKRYYPTILFFIVGDFSYALVTYNYPLWEFESPLLKTTGSDFLITMVFFAATWLVYLPHFPEGRARQVVYILFWVTGYTLIELLSYSLGFFSYHNGWSIGWSALFNLMMFPLMRLHYKNPPLAWSISVIAAFTVIIFFRIPFASMK